jgi:hypothetical protein
MNTTYLLLSAAFSGALTIVCASPPNLPSAPIDYIVRYELILKRVPALELPARSAELVTAAAANDKEPVGLAIVDVLARTNPSALPTVIAAIGRKQPSISTKLAQEAIALEPKLGSAIKTATVVVSQGGNGTTPPTAVGQPQPVGTGTSVTPLADQGGGGNNQGGNGQGNGNKKGHYKDN